MSSHIFEQGVYETRIHVPIYVYVVRIQSEFQISTTPIFKEL